MNIRNLAPGSVDGYISICPSIYLSQRRLHILRKIQILDVEVKLARLEMVKLDQADHFMSIHMDRYAKTKTEPSPKIWNKMVRLSWQDMSWKNTGVGKEREEALAHEWDTKG